MCCLCVVALLVALVVALEGVLEVTLDGTRAPPFEHARGRRCARRLGWYGRVWADTGGARLVDGCRVELCVCVYGVWFVWLM